MAAISAGQPRPAGGVGLFRARRLLVGLGFLIPFYLPFLLFFVAPILYAIFESTQSIERTGGVMGSISQRFSGLHQYALVLSDSDFIHGVERVLIFACVQVPIMTVISVSLALLLAATAPRLAGFFRTSFFVPYAVPTVIAALMWASLYQPSISPFGPLTRQFDFLNSGLVFGSIANIGIWGWAGFNVILMTTALSAVSPEIIDAARIDGASEITVALRVRLPLIQPTIIMSVIFGTIGSLQLFTEPLVLRSVSSVITSGYTPNMLAYSNAVANNYNFAAAISVTLAIVTFALSFGFLRVVRRRAHV
jgi:multiple sugar transport system permease protein